MNITSQMLIFLRKQADEKLVLLMKAVSVCICSICSVQQIV